ncbi:multidrug resistance protein [Actinobacillus equuli]|nr:multidrug resistance protein [Actinobacillus equuli]
MCGSFDFVFLNSHWILDYMNTPQAFSIKSQQYLAIMAIGVVPALLAVNLRCMNDGLSNPKPAMRITFLGLLLNIPLNYILFSVSLDYRKWGGRLWRSDSDRELDHVLVVIPLQLH